MILRVVKYGEPVLEKEGQAITEFDGKLAIAKVNIDDNDSIAVEYGVRAIPTMIVFKGGQEVDRMVGAGPKNQIAQLIDRAL